MEVAHSLNFEDSAKTFRSCLLHCIYFPEYINRGIKDNNIKLSDYILKSGHISKKQTNKQKTKKQNFAAPTFRNYWSDEILVSKHIMHIKDTERSHHLCNVFTPYLSSRGVWGHLGQSSNIFILEYQKCKLSNYYSQAEVIIFSCVDFFV